MKNDRNLKKIVLICAGFAVLFAVIIGGLHIMESAVFNSEPEQNEPEPSKTVEKEEIKNKKEADYNVKFFPITKVFLGNRMSSDKRKEIIDNLFDEIKIIKKLRV